MIQSAKFLKFGFIDPPSPKRIQPGKSRPLHHSSCNLGLFTLYAKAIMRKWFQREGCCIVAVAIFVAPMGSLLHAIVALIRACLPHLTLFAGLKQEIDCP
jgi:hypothetical protein